METPRFANHLPEGEFLDWAFRETAGRANFSKTAGAEVVKELWETLDDLSAARAAARSEDPELLDWIARHSELRSGVRTAVLSNPTTALQTVVTMLSAKQESRDREILERSRSGRDLGELTTRGLLQAEHPRQAIGWMAGYAAEIEGEAGLLGTLRRVEEQHHPEFVAQLLRTDPAHAKFPLPAVAAVLTELPAQVVGDGMWRLLGQHLAARGTDEVLDNVLALTGSVALRAELLARNVIGAGRATKGLGEAEIRSVIKRLPAERLLTIEDLDVLKDVPLTAAEWHEKRFEPEAAAWATTNGSEPLAAAAVWFVSSDPLLVRTLRRNTASHAFAGRHIWRLGRLWPRLSNRTRELIVGELSGPELNGINIAEIRSWVITHAVLEKVETLQLTKPETKVLVERVERTLEPALAWLAAKAAERPRDRIRMAEIGLREDPGGQKLREWLRSAGANEIVRLWHLAEPSVRDDMSTILVGMLGRNCDDTAWVEKLLPELRTDWQNAPHLLQEHAGKWLSDHITGEQGRTIVWGLYNEWQGTLEELVATAKEL